MRLLVPYITGRTQHNVFTIRSMTLNQFNALREAQQHEAVRAHGVELGQRVDEAHRITLYQIHGFYVEVYHHIKEDVIKRYRSFMSTELLAPYIEHINVRKLF